MKDMKAKLKQQGGFTLIEMLLVVAIISILVAVSIPVVNMNLEKARDAADLANERAAKTLATLVYMGEIDMMSLGEGYPYDGYFAGTAIDTWWDETQENKRGLFYDAEHGTLTLEKPIGKGYGQCTGCGNIDNGGASHVDCVILASVDANGAVTIEWVSDQDEHWGD